MLGLYRGMEKKMESAIEYRGHVRVMENKMETTREVPDEGAMVSSSC